MKLQPRTIQILKNYSTINSSMLFKKGHHQMTMHPMKKMLVRACIEEEIPAEFAIIDLSKFIGTLSLFSEPNVEVGKKFVTISEKGQKVNFTFADPEMIVVPTVSGMKMPSEAVKFKLIDTAMSQLMKAVGILGLPHVVIRGDGEKVEVGATRCDDPSSNKFMVEVGLTDRIFQLVIDAEHWKVLPGTYDVTLAEEGYVHLLTKDIEYWMTTEAKYKQFD